MNASSEMLASALATCSDADLRPGSWWSFARVSKREEKANFRGEGSEAFQTDHSGAHDGADGAAVAGD